MSCKFIITGAAGFIGSNICGALLAQGAEVVGVDNLNDYYRPAIKNRRLKNLLPNPKFVFYKTDILKTNRIVKIINTHKPEVLIHTAAQGYKIEVAARIANPVEPQQTRVDTRKLKKIYNTDLKTGFETGFRKTADFFYNNLRLYL